MDDKSKDDFIQLFNQGFTEIVQPELEEIREEMASKSDIDRLERKVDRLLDESIDQNKRLNIVESLPTIAHELKFRK